MTQGNIKKAGGILIQDRKFMLERHGGKSICVVPGGKLEAGETAEQALIREFEEEFHIRISPEDLEPLGTFEAEAAHSPGNIVSIHTFLVKKWEGSFNLDDGIEEIVWVNSQNAHEYELSSIASSNILPLLLEKGLID